MNKVGGSGDSNTDIVRDSRPLTPTPSPAPPTDTRSADAVLHVRSEELQQLQHSFQQNSLAPNSVLYYGRGVRSSRPHSKAVQDFEKKIKAMTGDEDTGGEEKKDEDKVCGSGDGDGSTDIVRDSRPLTPTPSPALPTDTRSADAVFITEPQNHQN